MVIDFHQHLYRGDIDEHLSRTRELCKKLGVDKICLFSRDNAAVEEAAKRYPDLVIPFVYLHPGFDDHSLIEPLHEKGFRGIKLIRPSADYDDERFFPIYEKAQELGMPILFHTGVLGRRGNWENPPEPEDISSARMHPLKLDRIARLFPRLAMVAAHLGVPSFDEAGMVARWNYNVYVDLTGALPNRLRLLGKERAFTIFGNALWWENAMEKVVFGSDYPAEDMEAAVRAYHEFLDWMNVSDEVRKNIMGETARKLLNL